ncbi:hypothetical protein HMPREF1531_00460 [Propionibacterium sp. oral taxon 192 str. F0372]|uniref:ABC transporter ATP-binding protein n=1 Tax=Propionibacterium sp. oral taxon 192 TaxID=671222 RepID=UPI000352D8D0|nr:ABC transporter ATP-binding protein [Propionibacterium sp. oral taxon 192]EPH06858.1 hypothetical protein HMPREF1531_00460 [Propionibacterium sp. oral taxon 192 str. F0372]
MIEATDIVVERGGRTILHGVEISAQEREVVGIVGPNGCGKSTLMLALHRSLELASGKVIVDGDDVKQLKRREIATRIAVVAQEREAALALSVRDSVALGRLASRSMTSYGDETDQHLVDEALVRVDLVELADRLVTELSGGERQRVMIARAIAQQATHLLLDEPTNHLDLHHQFALLDLIAELKCTTVVVLHDLNLASRCCDRVVLMNQGLVVRAGTPEEVLTSENLSSIYQLEVETITHNGRPYLIFDKPDNTQ